MSTFLSALPLIGCVAMTLGCTRMMGRRSTTAAQAAPEELSELKEEVAALRAELAASEDSTPAEGPRVRRCGPYS